MPITKRQFTLGINADIDKFMRRVYRFLATNREQAYTEDEIAEAVKVHYLEPTYNDFSKALEVLETVGAIERRQVHGTYYYGFGREGDEESWEMRPNS